MFLGLRTVRIRSVVLSVLTACGVSVAIAQEREVESTRLDNEQFRRGLIERDLFDLLEYYLAKYPPKEAEAELTVRREIKLAEWSDADADYEDRLAALAEANSILRQIISVTRDDRRKLELKLELVRSLIYEQAEPYYSNIYYRGGSAEDRASLLSVINQASRMLDDTLKYLEREYERIDKMSVEEYERLDDSGHILLVETALPQARYMQRWAKFYQALGLGDDSEKSKSLLREVLAGLQEDNQLLTEDHAQSHVQAQSLLLAGMTCRLLGQHESACGYLQKAINVVETLRRPAEKEELQWLVILGSFERVRALRDGSRFDEAERGIANLENLIGPNGDSAGLRLAVSILQSSVLRAEANHARRRGDAEKAKQLEAEAFATLRDLAKERTAYRNEIYASLYDQIRSQQKNGKLTSFEKCVLVAGHIADAVQARARIGRNGLSGEEGKAEQRKLEAEAIDSLDEAISLAKGLIADRENLEQVLYCEALYNLGVAQHHRGLLDEAAGTFSEMARQCPHDSRALTAAVNAVEIAFSLYEEPALSNRESTKELCKNSLWTLVENFKGSDPAEYWRFFLAQTLEDSGELQAASKMYRLVKSNHPQYLIARFRSLRCAVSALESTDDESGENAEGRAEAKDLRKDILRFQGEAKDKLAATGAGDDGNVRRALAESELILAELDVQPLLNRPEEALELLEGFEQRYAGYTDLIGRVLLVRIDAYETTGQMEEVKRAVPRYITTSPQEAGPVLQAMFEQRRSEINRCRLLGRHEEVKRKTDAAVLFAEELHSWASEREKNGVSAEDLYWFRLQLAEVYLESGRVKEARVYFQQCVDEDAQRYSDGQSHDRRAVGGLADSCYREDDFESALPLYNRMFRELPSGSDAKMEALLRDLQCRTELNHDPQGIVNAIRQHQYMDPEMGGPKLKRQFENLLRRNESRQEQSVD